MILIPRPAPNLPHTLEAFRAAGLTGLLPLALSNPESLPVTLPENATALIITSVQALQPGLPPLPTFAIGDATAEAARKAGLPIQLTGHADGGALASAMLSHLAPNQHVVHLHGDFADMHWHHVLTNAGHTVTPVLAYRTNRVEALPEEVLSQLGEVTHTLLFSAGSATHLAELIRPTHTAPQGIAVALSPQVATAARAYWGEVRTAESPTLQAMIDLCRS